MKRALFLRELRRLGTVGLPAAAALLLLPALRPQLPLAPRSLVRPDIVLCVGALLLGVLSISPELASGAHHFLRRLPISLAAQFRLRVAAGAAWLAVLLGSCAFAVALETPEPGLPATLPLSLSAPGAGVAFTAGLFASLASANAVAAVVLAGLSLAAGIGLYVLPLAAAGATFPSVDFLSAAGLGLGLAFLLAAGRAFRTGRIHEGGFRPFGVGISVLTVLVLLCGGGTLGARSYSRGQVLERLELGRFSAATLSEGPGRRACLLQGESLLDHEGRLVVWDEGASPQALDAQGLCLQRFELSPAGGAILADSLQGELLLYRLPSGEASRVELPFTWRYVAWAGDEARALSLSVRGGLRVAAPTPAGAKHRSLRLELPAENVELAGTDAAGRVYLHSSRGLERLSGVEELPLGAHDPGWEPPAYALEPTQLELLLPPDPSRVRVAVGPRGRCAVALYADDHLEVHDLASGRARLVPPLRSDDAILYGYSLELNHQLDPFHAICFRADGGAVLIEHLRGRAAWVDLAREEVALTEAFREADLSVVEVGDQRYLLEAGALFPPALSPDGLAATLTRGALWRAGQPAPERGVERTWAWLPEGRLVGGVPTWVAKNERRSLLGGVQ